jgi:hypothetical protein
MKLINWRLRDDYGLFKDDPDALKLFDDIEQDRGFNLFSCQNRQIALNLRHSPARLK